MPKLNFLVSAIACLALIASCSDDASNVKKSNSEKLDNLVSIHSGVDRPIALKDLTIGMNIKKIKGAKKYYDKAYMFDFDYFGGKEVFRASTNDEGVIYRYEANLNGSFDALKSALEEKFTADNGRSIIFDCKKNIIKPDSSAEIGRRACRITSQSEILIIEEMKMQPTAKYAGLNQLPTVIVSIKLEGTLIAADARTTEENINVERQKANDAQRKKDI